MWYNCVIDFNSEKDDISKFGLLPLVFILYTVSQETHYYRKENVRDRESTHFSTKKCFGPIILSLLKKPCYQISWFYQKITCLF